MRPIRLEDASNGVPGVRLDDGELIAADTVVVGVGSVPRTDLAARAGLAVADGIVVDGEFRSSEDRVFAAGDVAQVFHAREGRHIRLEQWRPAEEQGRQAAASMLGVGEPFRDIPWMWSDQHDLHLQATGFGFADASIVLRGSLDGPGGVSCLGISGSRLVAACGASVGTGVAKTIRAAQILIDLGVPVDVQKLGDPTVDLRRLAREVTHQAR